MIADTKPDLEKESEQPAAAESFSLLVVDDNEANRDALCRRLRRRGYNVTTAVDGAQALDLVAAGRFDLILLDIMMPGINGLEVLQRLRETHPATELPIIMASAKDESQDIVRALEIGANDYVTKPIDFAVTLARVRTQLTLKHSIQQVMNLEQRLSLRNAELEESNARLRRDLEAAARIQKAFLPKSLPTLPGLNFAWTYLPCETLAGDFLNVCPLDATHAALYVLDVSGHGVAAALLSVTLSRVLSPAGPDSLLLHDGPDGKQLACPAEVADRLSQKFPWDQATEQFFTIVYGIVDAHKRQFRYISAGHPGVVHLSPNAAAIHAVAGFPIGLGGGYEEHTLSLQEGDRFYLYSDGVTDVMNVDGRLFGNERLLQALDRRRKEPLEQSIRILLDDLHRWSGDSPRRDDVSILAVEVT